MGIQIEDEITVLCKGSSKVIQCRGISIIRWTKWSILQTLRTPVTIYCLYSELMNREHNAYNEGNSWAESLGLLPANMICLQLLRAQTAKQ